MALGSNRDYYSWDKTIRGRIKASGMLRLWKCPECGRKNYMKFENCPRCNAPKETKDEDHSQV